MKRREYDIERTKPNSWLQMVLIVLGIVSFFRANFKSWIHILGFRLGFFFSFSRFVWWVVNICVWLICCVRFFHFNLALFVYYRSLVSFWNIFCEWMAINSAKVTINICSSGVNSNKILFLLTILLLAMIHMSSTRATS